MKGGGHARNAKRRHNRWEEEEREIDPALGEPFAVKVTGSRSPNTPLSISFLDGYRKTTLGLVIKKMVS